MLTRYAGELQDRFTGGGNDEVELGRVGVEPGVALGGAEKLGALIPYCSSCEFNLLIPADPVAIMDVSAGVNDLLATRQWPTEEVMRVELAVHEALANAVRHGCKNDPGKQVQCCVTLNAAGELVIVIRDPGPGFDVTAVPNPLEAGNLLKPSGRGVFLINQLMDSVEFTDGGRQVLMRKRHRELGAAARMYPSIPGRTTDPLPSLAGGRDAAFQTPKLGTEHYF